MKSKFLWVAFLQLTSLLSANAQGICFLDNFTYEQLLSQAQKEDKAIFVDLYTDWCSPCRKMGNVTFKDVHVASYFNENFLNIRLNPEKQANHPFFKKYKASLFPAFFWLDKNGDLLDTQNGFYEPETFLALARKAKGNTLIKELKACQTAWEQGDRSAALVQKYLFDLLPKTDVSKIRPLLNDYLATLSPVELSSATTCGFVCHFTQSIQSDKVSKTFLEHYTDYLQQDHTLSFQEVYRFFVRVPVIEKMIKKNDKAAELLVSEAYAHKELFQKLQSIETALFNKAYDSALSQIEQIRGSYLSVYPQIDNELFYSLIVSDFFTQTKDLKPELISSLAGQALRNTPDKIVYI